MDFEWEEEHASLHRVRIFKCPRNHNHNHDHDHKTSRDLVLFNVLTTIPAGQPNTLSESLHHQHVLKDFPENWERICLADDKKALPAYIAKQNIFQADTDLKLTDEIHNYVRSLFCFDTIDRTSFFLVFVLDIHRWAFTKEFLDNLDHHVGTSVHGGDGTLDNYATYYDYEREYICYEYYPLNDNPDLIVEWVRRIKGDPCSGLVDVKPSIDLEELNLDIISTNKRHTRHIVAQPKEGTCSICWAPFDGIVAHNSVYEWLPEDHSWHLVRLNCGHVFHHRCIFKWLPKNPSCPYCRSSTLTLL